MKYWMALAAALLAVSLLTVGCGSAGDQTLSDDGGGSDGASFDGASFDGAHRYGDGSQITSDGSFLPDAGSQEDGAIGGAITVVVGGDIAESGRTVYARGNAANVLAYIPPVSALVLLGDNVRYNSIGGLRNYYENYYQPAAQANWGQFDVVAFPQTGNHEYNESNAQGYFDYFASRMTAIKGTSGYHGFVDTVGKGYYSFDLNGWHIISLNSNHGSGQVSGGCGSGSAQELWLKSDLAGHATMPIIAVWHAPRYTCGGILAHSGDTGVQALWNDLYDAGADFVFNGHNHFYQRYQPMNKTGSLDTSNGLTEIITGSMGVSTYSVCASPSSLIAKHVGGEGGMGTFFLTLGANGNYSFHYQLEDGSIFDSGVGMSHHAH